MSLHTSLVKVEEEKKKIAQIVDKELISEFGKSEPSDEEYVKAYIQIEAKELRSKYENHYRDPKLFEQVRLLVTDSAEAMLHGWSSNNAENRGSIVSNILPFLQQFQTPEMKRVFSPTKEKSCRFFITFPRKNNYWYILIKFSNFFNCLNTIHNGHF